MDSKQKRRGQKGFLGDWESGGVEDAGGVPGNSCLSLSRGSSQALCHPPPSPPSQRHTADLLDDGVAAAAAAGGEGRYRRKRGRRRREVREEEKGEEGSLPEECG